MTSSTRQVEAESDHLYSDVAEKLVVDGYQRINSYFNSFLERGEFSKGTFMKEVLSKLSSVPPLLDADEFVQLRRSEGLYESEDVLGVIWSILKDKCGEYGLLPAVAIDRDHEQGKIVVRLY